MADGRRTMVAGFGSQASREALAVSPLVGNSIAHRTAPIRSKHAAKAVARTGTRRGRAQAFDRSAARLDRAKLRTSGDLESICRALSRVSICRHRAARAYAVSRGWRCDEPGSTVALHDRAPRPAA